MERKCSWANSHFFANSKDRYRLILDRRSSGQEVHQEPGYFHSDKAYSRGCCGKTDQRWFRPRDLSVAWSELECDRSTRGDRKRRDQCEGVEPWTRRVEQTAGEHRIDENEHERLVPGEGFEPTLPFGEGDFKSPASAFPPPGLRFDECMLRSRLPQEQSRSNNSKGTERHMIRGFTQSRSDEERFSF